MLSHLSFIANKKDAIFYPLKMGRMVRRLGVLVVVPLVMDRTVYGAGEQLITRTGERIYAALDRWPA